MGLTLDSSPFSSPSCLKIISMKPHPYSEEAQKRMAALIEEMEGQTDRGVAIVGAAWVEEAMTEAIESFLRPAPEAWRDLFGDRGGMSTLSAKIDLSRLLGLISESIRSDLHNIRRVRNAFAHQIVHEASHEKLSFQTDHIRDRCLPLKCIEHEKIKEPRKAFVRACAKLNGDFGVLYMIGDVIPEGMQIVPETER